MTRIRHVVFDIGNVLLPWHRDRPFRNMIADPGERARFLAEICSPDWHLGLDRGMPVDDAIAALAALHPERADCIRAYKSRWLDMFEGADEAVVAILAELVRKGFDVTALSNFNQDLFALTVPAYPFLGWFRGATVSGTVRLVKPDPAIYALHAQTFGLEPAATLFFDDSPPNVEAARAAGWNAELFTDAAAMRRDLARWGIETETGADREEVTAGAASSAPVR
ncbi:HAD family phosphatase [Propylenella binzhouense]